MFYFVFQNQKIEIFRLKWYFYDILFALFDKFFSRFFDWCYEWIK
jgi:hypothetical protein